MKYLIALVFLSVISTAYAAQAQTARQPDIIPYKCIPTPSVDLNFPPNDQIGKTNNLWRETGLAVPAIGRPIYIRGFVLDKKCVPVQGAVVQIWQADSAGNYRMGTTADKKTDPYFSGSGTTYTNNQGEYSFITVFPGALEKEAPYIRFRVKQNDMETLRTKMFFAGVSSIADEDYRSLSADKRALLTAVSDPKGASSEEVPMTYYFNLILDGEVPYKRY